MTAPGGAGGPSPEEVQRALMHGESLRAHLQTLDEQEAYLADLLADAERGRAALEALKGLGAGEELLLPVGAGNFVRATVADAGRVIVGLGSGVQMDAGVETALERLKERVESLTGARKRVSQEVDRVSAELHQVNALLQEAQGVQ